MEDRYAVRVVLFDQNGAVALVKSAKHAYYKIPGGGIEVGESAREAAVRETLEESGCECEILAELGRVETPLPDWGIYDISDGFTARVIGEKGEPQYEAWEQERGFGLEWHDDPFAAVQMISENVVADESARLMQERDLTFLKRALKIEN